MGRWKRERRLKQAGRMAVRVVWKLGSGATKVWTGGVGAKNGRHLEVKG